MASSCPSTTSRQEHSCPYLVPTLVICSLGALITGGVYYRSSLIHAANQGALWWSRLSRTQKIAIGTVSALIGGGAAIGSMIVGWKCILLPWINDLCTRPATKPGTSSNVRSKSPEQVTPEQEFSKYHLQFQIYNLLMLCTTQPEETRQHPEYLTALDNVISPSPQIVDEESGQAFAKINTFYKDKEKYVPEDQTALHSQLEAINKKQTEALLKLICTRIDTIDPNQPPLKKFETISLELASAFVNLIRVGAPFADPEMMKDIISELFWTSYSSEIFSKERLQRLFSSLMQGSFDTNSYYRYLKGWCTYHACIRVLRCIDSSHSPISSSRGKPVPFELISSMFTATGISIALMTTPSSQTPEPDYKSMYPFDSFPLRPFQNLTSIPPCLTKTWDTLTEHVEKAGIPLEGKVKS